MTCADYGVAYLHVILVYPSLLMFFTDKTPSVVDILFRRFFVTSEFGRNLVRTSSGWTRMMHAWAKKMSNARREKGGF